MDAAELAEIREHDARSKFWDKTSGHEMGLAERERAALLAYVDELRGMLDLIANDCETGKYELGKAHGRAESRRALCEIAEWHTLSVSPTPEAGAVLCRQVKSLRRPPPRLVGSSWKALWCSAGSSTMGSA